MGIIQQLEAVILDRKANPQAGSYTCSLFDKGLEEIEKKVGEEAIEVIVAAANQSDTRLSRKNQQTWCTTCWCYWPRAASRGTLSRPHWL